MVRIRERGSLEGVLALASLPEYHDLLLRAAIRFELALRAHRQRIVAHNLTAFIGSPGATVPVHYDPTTTS